MVCCQITQKLRGSGHQLSSDCRSATPSNRAEAHPPNARADILPAGHLRRGPTEPISSHQRPQQTAGLPARPGTQCVAKKKEAPGIHPGKKPDKISTRWIRETHGDFRAFLDKTDFPDPLKIQQTKSNIYISLEPV